MRAGYNRVYTIFNWSLGLQLHNYAYSLRQNNYISVTSRSQQEDWTEYIWSWGAGLKFKYFTLSYNGRVITGSGIPDTFVNGWAIFNDMALKAADFIAAPSGKMGIDYQKVTTHQFVLQVPLSFENREN